MAPSCISTALIGHGYWGPNLARNIVENDLLDLVMICDEDDTVRKAAMHKWGCDSAASLDAALTDDTIAAVVIATPSGKHYEHAKAALSAGKHVLIEKPMATTLDHANDLVQHAENAGLTLMVGHTFMYNNIVHDIRERIVNGELGEIYYVYSQRLNLGQFRQDTNVVWTLAPHDISILDFWLDDYPIRVQANAMTFARPESDIAEVAFVVLEYPGGRFAHLHLSWLDPLKSRKMVVIGSKKMLVYDDATPGQHIQIYDKGVELSGPTVSGDMLDFTSRLRSGDVVIPNIRMKEPLASEINHFAECIRDNNRPTTDGKHGARVIATLAAIEKSIKKKNGWVDIVDGY